MAGQASRAEPGGPFGGGRYAVRVVAGAAPQAIARHPLAGALRELLDVAVHLQAALSPRRRSRRRSRDRRSPGPVVREFAAGAFDTGFAREMALGADRIAARRLEFRRVDHLALAFDVERAGPVAALAGHAILFEGRIGVGVLRALAPARLTGMAGQARGFDGAIPARDGVALVSRRHVPLAGLGVPRDRCLEEKSVARVEKAASRRRPSQCSNRVAARLSPHPSRNSPDRSCRCRSARRKCCGGSFRASGAGRLRPLLIAIGVAL